jgi:hypothetical protein
MKRTESASRRSVLRRGRRRRSPIAPRESESVEQLAEVWEAEIERRAERVLSGVASGAPADEVFARIAAKLSKR